MERLPWERAIIIGASSGIGEALARRLGAVGVFVALVARREDRLTDIASSLRLSGDGRRARAYVHDVRQTEAVPALFQQIATELGGLDLVIYCAGIMPSVDFHEYPTQRDLATIETNLSGAVAWLNEAAERFERAGRGTIVGISSSAGERGRRRNMVYGATKAALNTYLESLRVRLGRVGVRVVTVKPGYVRTDLTAAGLPPFPPAISPDRAAEEILEAMRRGRRVAFVPGWWRYVMFAVRALPAPLFERLSI